MRFRTRYAIGALCAILALAAACAAPATSQTQATATLASPKQSTTQVRATMVQEVAATAQSYSATPEFDPHQYDIPEFAPLPPLRQTQAEDVYTQARLGQIDDAHLSPDGRALAVRSTGGVFMFNVADRAIRWFQTDYAMTVAWSHDLRYVAAGYLDGTIRIYDPTTGAIIRILAAHSHVAGITNYVHPFGRYVTAITWSADDARLATTSDNGQLKVWDVESGQELQSFQFGSFTRDTGQIENLYFSPDGTRLMVSNVGTDESGIGLSAPLSMLDVERGTTLATLEPRFSEFPVRASGWSPDGSRFAYGDDSQNLVILDGLTGEHLATLPFHASYIHHLHWLDDNRVFTWDTEKVVAIWDVDSGEVTDSYVLDVGQAALSEVDPVRIRFGFYGGISAITWNPDSSQFVANLSQAMVAEDNGFFIWDVGTRRKVTTAEQPIPAYDFQWTSDGLRFVSAPGSSPNVTVYAGADATQLWTLEGGYSVTEVAWSPDGRRLASGERDLVWVGNAGGISIWDRDGKRLQWLAEDTYYGGLNWLQGGTSFLYSTSPVFESISTWKVDTPSRWVVANLNFPERVTTWMNIGQEYTINNARISPDGQRVILMDSTFRVVDTSTGSVVCRTLVYAGESVPLDAAWSPDGTKVAIVYERHRDEPILSGVYDGNTCEQLAELPEAPDILKRVAWSPDGTILALGYAAHRTPNEVPYGSTLTPGIVSLYDATTAAPLTILHGSDVLPELGNFMGFSELCVTGLDFSPDGSLLAAAYGDCERSAGNAFVSFPGAVAVWDTTTWSIVGAYRNREWDVPAIAFSPDGAILAAGIENGTVLFFDVTAIER